MSNYSLDGVRLTLQNWNLINDFNYHNYIFLLVCNTIKTLCVIQRFINYIIIIIKKYFLSRLATNYIHTYMLTALLP